MKQQIIRDGMLWPGGYLQGPPGLSNAPAAAIVSEPALAKIEQEPLFWITPGITCVPSCSDLERVGTSGVERMDAGYEGE